MYGPGYGILNAVMATDCDVSNPGPGNRTTSGCELIEWWVCHLRWGWTAAWGPCCQPTRRRPPGCAPVPLLHVLLASSTSSCCPLPRQRTDTPCRFSSWISILVTLFCFLKIPPACSSRRRRCSLAVPFFKSDLLAGGLALSGCLSLGCVSLRVSNRPQEAPGGEELAETTRGLSLIFKISIGSIPQLWRDYDYSRRKESVSLVVGVTSS